MLCTICIKTCDTGDLQCYAAAVAAAADGADGGACFDAAVPELWLKTITPLSLQLFLGMFGVPYKCRCGQLNAIRG